MANTPPKPSSAETPPDPARIKALLDMAAMQSQATTHKPPYKMLLIVSGVLVVIMVVAYLAVSWAAHHY